MQHFHNTTFRVGDGFALRIARAGYQSDAALASEVLFLEHLAGAGLPSVRPLRTRDGDPLVAAGDRRCLLYEWIPGRKIRASFGAGHARAMGEVAARLHSLTASFVPPPGFERQALNADSLSARATGHSREAVRAHLDADARRVVDRAASRIREAWDDIGPATLVHGDLIAANTLWVAGEPHLIDFDDLGWAPAAYDLAVSRVHLERDDLWAALREGYASVRALPPGLDERLEVLEAARRLFVACWLAGNLDNPSFTGVGRYLAQAIEGLREFSGIRG